MRSIRQEILLSIVTLGALTLSAGGAPAYQGMSYTPWSEEVLSSAGSDLSIANMAAIGVDTVALNIWAFQDDENATDIALDFNFFSASISSIEHAVEEIHSYGMKVMLKPNVDLRNGAWRGNINPSQAWFDSYSTFITDWATFSEENGVELLSIGTEYKKTESWDAQWRDVVSGVRQQYGGPITYSANWDSYGNVAWWDDLDSIGIDAYFPLAVFGNVSLEELTQAWENQADSIESWRAGQGLSQQVVFTEVGYRSVDGAVVMPWDFSSGGSVDLQEQADAYQALLTTMDTRSWWDGAFWWNWETDPNAGGLTNAGFTPQNKPVEEVLQSFYEGSAADAADLDSDGDVDIDDWTQFIINHPSDLSGMTQAEAFGRGDLDFDFDNDFDDFLRFEQVFDRVHGSGSFGRMLRGVPEPSSIELGGLFAVVTMLSVRTGRQKNVRTIRRELR